jgi:hypothetical protein
VKAEKFIIYLVATMFIATLLTSFLGGLLRAFVVWAAIVTAAILGQKLERL